MKRYGYAFVYGVDGFGADTAPALEEGIYLDFDKAFKHFCDLNKPLWKDNYFGDRKFENVEELCKYMYERDREPWLNMYLMVKVEIHKS